MIAMWSRCGDEREKRFQTRKIAMRRRTVTMRRSGCGDEGRVTEDALWRLNAETEEKQILNREIARLRRNRDQRRNCAAETKSPRGGKTGNATATIVRAMRR